MALTIDGELSPGAFRWIIINTNKSAYADFGYVVNGETQLLIDMPFPSNTGDRFMVCSNTNHGCKIRQTQDQEQILINTVQTIVGNTGYLEIKDGVDASGNPIYAEGVTILFICLESNRLWRAIPIAGFVFVDGI